MGIPLYRYLSEKKAWEKVKSNSEYDKTSLYINKYGIANFFEINYRDSNVTLININQIGRAHV